MVVKVVPTARDAPENIFAKRLASNEKKIRDKAVKKLRQWISSQSKTTFTKLELLKIWKGLFYCMYMSDKPLVQEELSESIGSIIHAFDNVETGLEFFRSGLKVIASEYDGIDKWRIDKFLMFLRRLLRHALQYVKNSDWSDDAVQLLTSILSEEVINANKNVTAVRVPLSMQVQYTDILMEEVAKVGGEGLDHEKIMPFVQIFIEFLAFGSDPRLRDNVKKYVFHHLINQSDVAIAHKLGVDVEELKELSEHIEAADSEDQPKDPRAGKVDIELPQLRPDYGKIASFLLEKAGSSGVRPASRKFMYKLVENFKDVAAGVYPLDPKVLDIPDDLTYEDINQATERFLEEEEAIKTAEMEERKKVRKERLMAKKNKQVVAVEEPAPAPISNNQLRRDRRKAALEEKLAKKALMNGEDHHDGPANKKAKSSSGFEVEELSETPEPAKKKKQKKAKAQAAEVKDHEGARESQLHQADEAIHPAKLSKRQQKNTKAQVAQSDIVPAPTVAQVEEGPIPPKALPPTTNTELATKPRQPRPTQNRNVPVDGPAIPVDLSPHRNKTQKRKIEFDFDDDTSLDTNQVMSAIKKTKKEGPGPWVPGVKTLQKMRIDARMRAEKAGKLMKKKEEPVEELLEGTPYALLKTKPKKEPKVKPAKKPKIAKNTEATPATAKTTPNEIAEKAEAKSVAPVAQSTTVEINPVPAPEPQEPVPAPNPSQAKPIKKSPAQVSSPKSTVGAWDTSLKEGEIEIVIPNKKYTGKTTLKAAPKTKTLPAPILAKSSKVKFVLQKNIAQDPLEYMHAVKTSPGTPHDPSKRPRNGVLKVKDSPVPVLPSFLKKGKTSPKIVTNATTKKFKR